MISVLLTILKIIGITLLIILGIILLVLLFILFVPVRYRAKGVYHDRDDFTAEGHITWYLHMISAKAVYCAGQPFHLYLKVLGIPVYDNLKPNSRKPRNKKAKSTQAKPDSVNELQAASNDSQNSTDDFREQQEETDSSEFVFSEGKPSADAELKVQKNSLFKNIKTWIENFVNLFKNIKFTIRRICDTIIRIKNNIGYYLKVLQLESTKQAFATCQKQISRIFRNLSPKKFQARLHLGFDDPSVMGDVLAVWGMLYPWHQGNIDIQPDFENPVMEGDFLIKGRVSIYVLVWTALILLFDRNIKLLIKHLKHNN